MNSFEEGLCFWCGKKNTNITLNEKCEVIETRPCNECNQPERLNEMARKGCDSLNFVEIQRERSEEITPPKFRNCRMIGH